LAKFLIHAIFDVELFTNFNQILSKSMILWSRFKMTLQI